MNEKSLKAFIFASHLCVLANCYSKAKTALEGAGFSAWKVFVENDWEFLCLGEELEYESLSAELSAVSISNLSGTLSYWGAGVTSFSRLNAFKEQLWKEEMQYWFSPLPWHVRQWQLYHGDKKAYFQKEEELNRSWRLILQSEARKCSFLDAPVSKSDVVAFLTESLIEFGFEIVKKREHYFWEKRINEKWILAWSFDFKESGLESAQSSFGLPLRLFLKKRSGEISDTVPRFKTGVQIPYEVIGPYICRAYGVFEDLGQMKNAINARLCLYAQLHGIIEPLISMASLETLNDW